MMAQDRDQSATDFPQIVANCTPVRPRSFAPLSEEMPIWLAALMASHCQATRAGGRAPVSWKSECGKALYTNAGSDTVWILPFGVALPGGQTLAVSWSPGETAYTLEVFS